MRGAVGADGKYGRQRTWRGPGSVEVTCVSEQAGSTSEPGRAVLLWKQKESPSRIVRIGGCRRTCRWRSKDGRAQRRIRNAPAKEERGSSSPEVGRDWLIYGSGGRRGWLPQRVRIVKARRCNKDVGAGAYAKTKAIIARCAMQSRTDLWHEA